MAEIEFDTGAGTAMGYLATPSSGGGLATIVCQEWWGVDSHIRSICDRFADEGFFALAPDLYRGATAEQPDEAQQRMMALNIEQAEKELCGAVDHLRALDGVAGDGAGAVGFCLGGGLAVWAGANCPNVKATVSYYYVMPHGRPDFASIGGPVLGHFGSADDFIPVDEARALEQDMHAAGVDAHFEFYEGAGHAFFNDTNRLGTYDRELAELSWERTVQFLRGALAP